MSDLSGKFGDVRRVLGCLACDDWWRGVVSESLTYYLPGSFRKGIVFIVWNGA